MGEAVCLMRQVVSGWSEAASGMSRLGWGMSEVGSGMWEVASGMRKVVSGMSQVVSEKIREPRQPAPGAPIGLHAQEPAADGWRDSTSLRSAGAHRSSASRRIRPSIADSFPSVRTSHTATRTTGTPLMGMARSFKKS